MTYIYRYSTAGRPSKAQNCSSNLLQGTRSAYCMPHTVQNDCSMQNVYLANYSSKYKMTAVCRMRTLQITVVNTKLLQYAVCVPG